MHLVQLLGMELQDRECGWVGGRGEGGEGEGKREGRGKGRGRGGGRGEGGEGEREGRGKGRRRGGTKVNIILCIYAQGGKCTYVSMYST